MMQILTMRMMMMMMMILMLSFLYSARADQSLSCYNDYFNTFTCVWDSLSVRPPVGPETQCWLHIYVQKERRSAANHTLMLVDRTHPQLRSGSVVFRKKYGVIITTDKLHHEVQCENYTNPVAKIPAHAAPDSIIKVSPPYGLEVHGLSVSWSFTAPRSLPAMFQVQYRSANQDWTDLKDAIRDTNDSKLELAEHLLLLGHEYVIRVRVKLSLKNAVWSDWSEERRWRAEVGLTPTTTMTITPGVLPGPVWSLLDAGIALTGVTLIFLLILTLKCRNRWIPKKPLFYIPDPSKFFGDLNSHHGGDFVSWLGPCESFIRVDTELVSPVEVLKLQDACDDQDSHRNSAALQDSTDTTAKSSNFSNSTYFMSESSKGLGGVLEPCSADSSYGPAGGVSTPEPDGELEQKLETLRRDTQSPDSGFAGGAEDSMEEPELPSPPALNLPPLLLDLLAPRPLTVLELHRSAPPSVCDIPELQLLLQSHCGAVEPSSEDYMPVKSVQNEC